MAEGDSPAEELRQRLQHAREVVEQQANAPTRSSQARSDSAQRTFHEHQAGVADVQLDQAICALIDALDAYPAHPALQRQWKNKAFAWAQAEWQRFFTANEVAPLWTYPQLVTAAEKKARDEARFVWQEGRAKAQAQQQATRAQARQNQAQAARNAKQARYEQGIWSHYVRLARELGPEYTPQMLWSSFPTDWTKAQAFVDGEKAKAKAEQAEAQADLEAGKQRAGVLVFSTTLALVGGVGAGIKLGGEQEVEYSKRVARNGKLVSEPAVRKEQGFSWTAFLVTGAGLFVVGRFVAPFVMEHGSAITSGARAGRLLK